MVGKTLAHYEITAKIGEGGMGEVYRARDGKLDRDVALKMLSPEFRRDPERLARFEREAKTLAALQHPNIASIYGFEEAEGQPFLVMELVEGEDLAERLRRGSLPPTVAREVARQIARGLEEAHDRGIVHRDLKPANVKIAPDGKVKILDFGLARALVDEPTEHDMQRSPTITAGMTQAGVILGTAAYMSPEQARGETVDKRADIWAFGCVLYEMLTGRAPFSGRTVTDLLADIVKTEPAWEDLPEDTPALMRALVWRCLRKEPRDRLRDIGDARFELSGTDLESTGVIPVVDIPESTSGAGTAVRRSWLLPAVGAAILGLVGGALGGRFLLDRSERAEPIVSRLAIRSIEHRPFSLRGWQALAITPDGRSVVYTSTSTNVSFGGGVQVAVRALDRDQAVLIPGTESGVSPFLSPDGQWVAYFDFASQTLKRVPIAGGQVSEICKRPSFAGGFWTPDDTIYFSSPNGGGLYRVPASGGEPELILALDEPTETAFYRPVVIDEQDVALFTVAYSDPQRPSVLTRLDLASGARRDLFPANALIATLPGGTLLFHENEKLLAREIGPGDGASVGPAVTLIDGVGSNVAVSASGTLIYVSSDAGDIWSGRVMLVSEQGVVEDALGEPLEYARYPRISPDGTKLAITSGPGGQGTLWVHDLVGSSPPVNLTFDGHNTFPVWSPDGSRIVFSRASGAGTRGRLSIVASDGSDLEPTPLDEDGPVGVLPGSWTEDDRIIFSHTEPGTVGNDIWEMPVDSPSGRRPLVQTQFDEGNTSMLSPDGRWLAYRSNRSGMSEIWVQRYPEGPAIPVTSGGATEPVWSRDGAKLYFQAKGAIMAVDVDGRGARMTFSKPRAVYEGPFLTYQALTPRTYDVHPDGRLLLIQRIEQDDRHADIIVVQNWFEEIREFLP